MGISVWLKPPPESTRGPSRYQSWLSLPGTQLSDARVAGSPPCHSSRDLEFPLTGAAQWAQEAGWGGTEKPRNAITCLLDPVSITENNTPLLLRFRVRMHWCKPAVPVVPVVLYEIPGKKVQGFTLISVLSR